MSDIEAQLKAWKDDPADHAVVYASDWSPDSRGVRRICQGCGHAISVWPVVANKMLDNPRFHVLCRERCLPIALKVNGEPLRFGGNVSNNRLPEGLEKFG